MSSWSWPADTACRWLPVGVAGGTALRFSFVDLEVEQLRAAWQGDV